MKKLGKYLFACLPFLMVLGIFFIVPNAISILLMLIFSITDGVLGINKMMTFYMDHLNLISCIFYTCALIPVGIWYYHKFYKKGQPIKNNRYLRPSSLGYIILLALGITHALDLLFILFGAWAPQALNDYSNMVESSGMISYSLTWFISTIILPPVMEELLFRGLTMRLFRRAGAPFFLANFLQALLFGIYHMNIVQGVYAFLIGLVMGYLANHYHTLLASMAFHACFNFFGTVLADLESTFFNDYLSLISMFLGFLLLTAALYFISRQRPKKTASSVPLLKQSPYDDTESPFI